MARTSCFIPVMPTEVGDFLAIVTFRLALYGHGGLIAQQGHISLNTNLYSSQF